MATSSSRPKIAQMIPETRNFVAANVIFIQFKDFFECEASFMIEVRSLSEEAGGVVHNNEFFLPGRGGGRRYQLKDAFKLMWCGAMRPYLAVLSTYLPPTCHRSRGTNGTRRRNTYVEVGVGWSVRRCLLRSTHAPTPLAPSPPTNPPRAAVAGGSFVESGR